MGRAGPGAVRQTDYPSTEGYSEPWKEEGLSRAQRVEKFLEYLPITKGRLEGTKMRLLPSQRKFVRTLYGPKANQIKIAVLSEPRGNGKTGLIAGLMLCHLLGPECERRGACYSAGKDRRQASIIFAEMEAIIKAVPAWFVRVNVQRFHKMMEVKHGDGAGSTYEALSQDGRGAHGLAPSMWAYDELAQAKNRELLTNLQTGMGKRKRSLGIVLSTQAESDEHPLSELIDDGLQQLNPSIHVQLSMAPKDANPFDVKTIKACNPAIGHFLDLQTILDEADSARRIKSFESGFRNRRLNQRIALDSDSQFLTAEEWDQGNGAIDERLFFDGRPVYGGLDLSEVVDLTGFCLACEDDERRVHLWPFGWTPLGTLAERSFADRVPYDAWVRDGQLFAPPGKTIDFDYVATDIARLTKNVNLVSLAFDPWRMRHFEAAMARVGLTFPMTPFQQGTKSMAPAINEFEALAKSGNLRHGGHKPLRWCTLSTKMIRNAEGFRKPDKRRYNTRIDLAVAAIMAVGTLKAESPTGNLVQMFAIF